MKTECFLFIINRYLLKYLIINYIEYFINDHFVNTLLKSKQNVLCKYYHHHFIQLSKNIL